MNEGTGSRFYRHWREALACLALLAMVMTAMTASGWMCRGWMSFARVVSGPSM